MSRILVIDDDRSVRHLIAKAFEDTDVEVVPAASAEEGMRLLGGGAVGCRAARYSAAGIVGPRSVRTDSQGRSEAAGDFHHVAFQQRHGHQGHDVGRVRLLAEAARPGANSRPGAPGDGNPAADEHSGRDAGRRQVAPERRRLARTAATRWSATASKCRKCTRRSAASRRRMSRC